MLADWYEWWTHHLASDALVDWTLGRFASGEPITADQRRTYSARPDLQSAFPDPYRTLDDPTATSYLAWFEAELAAAPGP